MVVRLREDELPPDDATVIVHLGAGAHDNLLDKAIRSYDDYREITSGAGLFVLSVRGAQGPRRPRDRRRDALESVRHLLGP
jgi:hypothetical protein